MISDIFAFLQQVANSVRVADVVDVALVALLLFPLLAWLRSGTSSLATRRVFVLVLVSSGVYLLARSFEMYMVEALLEALLIVALVAIVIVFQHELRRFINRLGAWRPFRSIGSERTLSPGIEDLVEAVHQLAETKTGALIALKGREPWADHIDGGIELDGINSQPLLYSLFHADTPGHDGAVLIEGSRITSFAAHLPLAHDLPEASRYGGTRHAAALGLSERCDALVIVVSEERGTFSVAEGGNLTTLDTTKELETRLTNFWRADPGPNSNAWPPRWLGTATLSIVASTFLWLVFAYSPGTILRTFDVPVQVRNLPTDWTLDVVEPRTTQITLSGAERAFNLLDPAALAVSFEFETLTPGENELTVGARTLTLPASLELYDVEPRDVRVSVSRLVPTEVAVDVPTIGALPEDLVLAGLTVAPRSVTVLVREDGAPPERIFTEPIDLRRIQASEQLSAGLVLQDGWRLPPDASADVQVTVNVRRESDVPQ